MFVDSRVLEDIGKWSVSWRRSGICFKIHTTFVVIFVEGHRKSLWVFLCWRVIVLIFIVVLLYFPAWSVIAVAAVGLIFMYSWIGVFLWVTGLVIRCLRGSCSVPLVHWHVGRSGGSENTSSLHLFIGSLRVRVRSRYLSVLCGVQSTIVAPVHAIKRLGQLV